MSRARIVPALFHNLLASFFFGHQVLCSILCPDDLERCKLPPSIAVAIWDADLEMSRTAALDPIKCKISLCSGTVAGLYGDQASCVCTRFRRCVPV
ncbi:hypothetical protein B0T14DRAFT_503822 [Immersiella caudata]|uniref:Secreted protein n=1 Tax=Immersiella caudata TaxID=314043 RepID=A0AA40CCB7_9PEZI|nr:hypothetical protein B0T14DRAFT_503822 [Immersiella caudata]